MNNLRYKLMEFMRGRYGVDSFSHFILGVSFVLILISMVPILRVLNYVGLALLIYCYFRILSRNIQKRYRENCWYLARKEKVVKFFIGLKYRFAQNKEYHIYKCPGCGQKIRIPRGKGNIMVRCPKCAREFKKHS